MPSAVVRKPLERITKYHRLNHDTLDVKIRDSGFTNAAVAEALGISEEYVRKLRILVVLGGRFGNPFISQAAPSISFSFVL